MKQLVTEITLTTNFPNPGDTATRIFAEHAFTTRPTDTPPNTYIPGRLINAGRMTYTLFSGNRVLGAVEPSYGETILENEDGELDEWADFVAEGGHILTRYGDVSAAYPAGYDTVYKCYTHNLEAGFEDVKMRMKDRLFRMKKTIASETLDGSGGLEGKTGSAGKAKPWVSGNPYYIPAVSVTNSLVLFLIQTTSPGTHAADFAVFEGMVPIEREANYTSANDLLCNAPTKGKARFWFGPTHSGPVYARLGGVPKDDVRFSCYGVDADGNPFTIAKMAELSGISGGTGDVPIGSVLIDDKTTYLELCEQACKLTLGYFFMSRTDEFRSGIFAAPDDSPLVTLDETNSDKWKKIPVTEMSAAIWKMVVRQGQGFKSNAKRGATFTRQDHGSRGPWWEVFSKGYQEILDANPGATVADIESICRLFDEQSQRDNFHALYFSLFGVKREYFTCEVQFPEDAGDFNMLSLNIMETVRGQNKRYKLNNGKNFRIITQDIDSTSRTIKLGLWG